MRIVKADCEVMHVDESTIQGIFKHIEAAGRTCYKSESAITDTSAKDFVSKLIASGHEAVIEHGVFMMQVDQKVLFHLMHIVEELSMKGYVCYLRFTNDRQVAIVSGNVRAWRDFFGACVRCFDLIPASLFQFVNKYAVLFPEYQDRKLFDNAYMGYVTLIDENCLDTDNERLTHVCRTIRFICDRGVSHEIVRHRPASYCQESTRYCNYSSEKFGEQISVIEPCYLDNETPAYTYWKGLCMRAEEFYFRLMCHGCTPQEARAVLPNSLKTEVVMSANMREWRHFFKLRCSKAAHPQMQEVAKIALKKLHAEQYELLDDIYEEVFR